MIRARIWCRVSTDAQDERTQLHDTEQFCAHHGWEITGRYMVHDASAYKGEQQAQINAMLDDAYRGEFDVLVVRTLDRIERRGIEMLLRLMRQLKERNARLASVRETWVNGSDEMVQIFAAMSAWQAQMDSSLKADKIRMGMAERRRNLAAGIEVKGRQAMGGRKAGSKNRAERADKGRKLALSDEERAARAERARAQNQARKAATAA